MATTPPRTNFAQEMPPPGGYKRLNMGPFNAKPRMSGAFMFGAVAVIVMGGFYKMGTGNVARNQVKMEKRERRYAIIPFLQAEEDVRYNREHALDLDQEKRAMIDRADWQVGKSVYNTREWMPPAKNKVC